MIIKKNVSSFKENNEEFISKDEYSSQQNYTKIPMKLKSISRNPLNVNTVNETTPKHNPRPNFISNKVNENLSYNISKKIQEKLRQRSNEYKGNSGFSEYVQNSKINSHLNNENNDEKTTPFSPTNIFKDKDSVFSGNSSKQYHPFICNYKLLINF